MSSCDYRFEQRGNFDTRTFKGLVEASALRIDSLVGYRDRSRPNAFLALKSGVVFFNAPNALPFDLVNDPLPVGAPLTDDRELGEELKPGAFLTESSAPGGNRVCVAVIDSGLGDAPLFVKSTRSVSFVGDTKDFRGHGTQVASVICGFATGNSYFAGTGAKIDLLVAKTHGSDSADNKVDRGRLELAVVWALENGAQILNVSLALARRLSTHPELSERIEEHLRLYPSALLIAAAGNNNSLGTAEPACAASAVAINGWDVRAHRHCTTCNQGDSRYRIFCSGPSDGIPSLAPRSGGYRPVNFRFTSAATAVASRAAVDILGRTTLRDASELKQALEARSVKEISVWREDVGGVGLLSLK